MPTDPRNLGPDGKDVEVSGEHLDQAAACLSTVTALRDTETVAQAIANAEARGLHAIDRPRGRELDHNTTAHRLRVALVDALDAEGRVPTAAPMDAHEQAARAALADAYAAGRADQLTEQTGAALALTAEQLRELRQVFYSMPYGGSLTNRSAGTIPTDGPELVEILGKLSKLLAILGRQEQERTAELEKLRRQREAFREYAGAGLLGLLALAEQDAPNPLELAHRAETIPPQEEEPANTSDLWERFTVTSTTHGTGCAKCAAAAEAAATHAAVTGSVGASYDDDGHRAAVQRIDKPPVTDWQRDNG
jgi:hypothetical protein